MSAHIAKPEHEIAYQEIVSLIRRQTDKHGLSAMEVLAIAANMLGKIVALQDQRTVTPAMAMKTVAANIEVGNKQALTELTVKIGGSA